MDKENIYMVTYYDDRRQKHITFVEGFSRVRILEKRYGIVYYEKTENYIQINTREFSFRPFV